METHTHMHTCPRDSNGICPEVCAKTGGSRSLQLGATACQSTALRGLAGLVVQLRVADNIHTGLPVDTFKGRHFLQKKCRLAAKGSPWAYKHDTPTAKA